MSVATHVRFSATYKCGQCKQTQTSELTSMYKAGMGCMGHNLGEYCYCAEPELRATFKCPRCGKAYDVLAQEWV